MPNRYEHTQKGSKLIYYLPILAALEFIFIAVLIGVINAHAEPPMSWKQLTLLFTAIAVFPAGIMAWVLSMMSSLTVSIDEVFIRIRFGPGVWKKKFAIDQVVACAAVKNTWSNGWGIHYIGKRCWLYNIAGSDAVELTFKNGKKARIGTDQPEKLAAAIESAIKTV